MATHKDNRGIATLFAVLFGVAMVSTVRVQNEVICDRI